MSIKENIKEYNKNIFQTLKLAPTLFLLLWLGGFLIIFAILFQVGWVPKDLRGDSEQVASDTDIVQEEVESANDNLVLAAETINDAVITEDAEYLPKQILIDSVDVDVTVRNPKTTDINVLNTELQSGAVRYLGSGDLEDESNMFIFGHSSYLPEVINKNYQAFNGIQNLEKGDVIRVRSDTHEYVYITESVELVTADETWISFSTGEKTLTLSTCNTFGKKQERHVVTARFMGKFERSTGA